MGLLAAVGALCACDTEVGGAGGAGTTGQTSGSASSAMGSTVNGSTGVGSTASASSTTQASSSSSSSSSSSGSGGATAGTFAYAVLPSSSGSPEVHLAGFGIGADGTVAELAGSPFSVGTPGPGGSVDQGSGVAICGGFLYVAKDELGPAVGGLDAFTIAADGSLALAKVNQQSDVAALGCSEDKYLVMGFDLSNPDAVAVTSVTPMGGVMSLGISAQVFNGISGGPLRLEGAAGRALYANGLTNDAILFSVPGGGSFAPDLAFDSLTLSPDAKWLLASEFGGVLRLRALSAAQPPTLTIVSTIPGPGAEPVWAPDGHHFFAIHGSAIDAYEVSAAGVITAAPVSTIDFGAAGAVASIHPDPTGHRLYVVLRDNAAMTASIAVVDVSATASLTQLGSPLGTGYDVWSLKLRFD